MQAKPSANTSRRRRVLPAASLVYFLLVLSMQPRASAARPAPTNPPADESATASATQARPSIELVSRDSAGRQLFGTNVGAAISGDGRTVALASDAVSSDPRKETCHMWSGQCTQAFVRDLATGDTRLITESWDRERRGDSGVMALGLSEDGSKVIFTSGATNLLQDYAPSPAACPVAETLYECQHTYIRDMQTGVTTPLDVAYDGRPADGSDSGAAISGNGRVAAFVSDATNLVEAFTPPVCFAYPPKVVLHCDQLYLWDGEKPTVLSVDESGHGANGFAVSGPKSVATSSSGDTIAFITQSTNLVGDTRTEESEWYGFRVLVWNSSDRSFQSVSDTYPGTPREVSLSADGSRVAWNTGQVYVRDLATGKTILASGTPTGEPSNGFSYGLALSGNGRYVSFSSNAPDIVPHRCTGPQLFCYQAYVRDLETGRIRLISRTPRGFAGNSGPPGTSTSIAQDGRSVAFDSSSDNLVPDDYSTGATDVFLWSKP